MKEGVKWAKVVFIGLLIASFGLSGCSFAGCAPGGQEQGPDEKLTIEWWGVDKDEEFFIKAIDYFESKYSNVDIKYVRKNPVSYEQELINALAANEGPDIAMIKSDWLAKHQKKLSPLEMSGSELDKIKEQYLEMVTDQMIDGSNFYGVPLNVRTLGLYYNRDLFSKNDIRTPPETWTDFNSTVKKITKRNDNYINVAGAALGTSSNISQADDVLLTMMMQNGTRLVSADGKSATFNTSVQSSSGEPIYKGRKALSYYVDFSNPNKDIYTWNSKMPSAWKHFADGKVGMLFDYQARAEDIYNRNPELDFEFARIPQIKNVEPGQERVIGEFWAHCVTKDVDNKKWAWSFLQTLSDQMAEGSLKEEAQRYRQSKLREEIFIGQGLIAETVYKGGEPAKYDDVIKTMINNVVVKDQKISNAIDSAANQVTDIYQSGN